jgi:carbamate kinase
MRVVAALGGNALLRRGEPLTPENQRANIRRAVAVLARLISGRHRVVITHGNGPQVGLLALQGAGRPDAFPLDVLGAETEGMIGYIIEQELRTLLPRQLFATLLTQVEVDPRDPALAAPAKPIGPQYDREQAERLAAQFGWAIARDEKGYRRVIASPTPRRILELATISLLVEKDVTVICTGGGGIPVVLGPDLAWRGVEAVIDKDHASALLAGGLGADVLLLLTDVEGVYRNWGQPNQSLIVEAEAGELSQLEFAPGSMAPKVSAAANFATQHGGVAIIGRLDDAEAMLEGRAGTRVKAG